jgi:hypothetical protein
MGYFQPPLIQIKFGRGILPPYRSLICLPVLSRQPLGTCGRPEADRNNGRWPSPRP